jgi:hypothetical protein
MDHLGDTQRYGEVYHESFNSCRYALGSSCQSDVSESGEGRRICGVEEVFTSSLTHKQGYAISENHPIFHGKVTPWDTREGLSRFIFSLGNIDLWSWILTVGLKPTWHPGPAQNSFAYVNLEFSRALYCSRPLKMCSWRVKVISGRRSRAMASPGSRLIWTLAPIAVDLVSICFCRSDLGVVRSSDC